MCIRDRFGGEDEGEAFAELLAHWDAGDLTDEQKKDIGQRRNSSRGAVTGGSDLEKWRFWDWLDRVASGEQDRHTASFF